MPLGTLDRTPPPFFKQGPSALSRLIFFSALALFLMVADTRLKVAQPLRATVATVLYPFQWLLMQPVMLASDGGQYLTTVHDAQQAEALARRRLADQSMRANQVETLQLENQRLRKLLTLREQLPVTSIAAEVLYDAADPYTRRVVIDRGQAHGVAAGSPVVDESGVLGQVTRVYPLVSEVTLVIDRDQAIPVLNTRTGARGVAFGDPVTRGGALELRFMPANADVLPGDLLTTSGVDGTYPSGIPVARVVDVERRADSAFARISCAPQALATGARHVLVLASPPAVAPTPVAPLKPASAKKGASRP
ncbi:MAG: rod shape-determining protein MreC [Burkholderiaceae bacterium]|nr:rod shape-determining protein MreC [Burkholderiaceae bacterium]